MTSHTRFSIGFILAGLFLTFAYLGLIIGDRAWGTGTVSFWGLLPCVFPGAYGAVLLMNSQDERD